MPKKMSDEEYYRTLPKKQVGTAVLLFDETGKLLIVKPDYKDTWLVPGGTTDENESPLHCAIRETHEEIGLQVKEMHLIGVHFSPAKGLYPDSLKFLFNGGILTAAQISSITLGTGEIDAYAFLEPTKAVALLSSSLRASVPACLEAISNGTIAYTEAVSAGAGI